MLLSPLHRGGGDASRRVLSKAALTRSSFMLPSTPLHGATTLLSCARGFSTKMPSILEPLPGLPELKPASDLARPETEVTTLPNGLKVASEETYGQVGTIALFVDAGSMYEQADERGVCHFLENLAFKSTENRTTEQIEALSAKHGMSMGAGGTREVVMYKVETLRGGAEDAVGLLADCATKPLLSPAELAMAAQVISFQNMDVQANPQLRIQEMAHAAAYGADSPLGQSAMCPVDRVHEVTADDIRRFMGTYFTAPRMVLAGAGVDHAKLVSYAEAAFGDLPTESVGTPIEPCLDYVGGEQHAESSADEPVPLTHLSLSFSAPGWSTEDMIPMCVLDTLLGGGSSFSVGGPGKGMYSRLYREMLNMHSWIEAANAYSIQFYKGGLFGLFGTCHPDHAVGLVNLFCFHLGRLIEEPVNDIELSRARNQLRSSVLMNLETRNILCEDVGRQVLAAGYRIPPDELCKRIEAVTAEDITRVITKALSHPPSFATVGNNTKVPSLQTLQAFFKSG